MSLHFRLRLDFPAKLHQSPVVSMTGLSFGYTALEIKNIGQHANIIAIINSKFIKRYLLTQRQVRGREYLV